MGAPDRLIAMRRRPSRSGAPSGTAGGNRRVRMLRGTAGIALAGCLLAVLMACGHAPAEVVVGTSAPSASSGSGSAALHLERGVNILSDDPIWRSRERARLTTDHVRLIAEAGFDHVRINLHPFRDGADSADPAVREAWFHVVTWAMDRALGNGLSVVLDMHEYEAMGRDPVGNHDRFLAFWQSMADRFSAAPPSVAFELLNEPNGELDAPAWNALLAETVAIVRDIDPARTLIVGPARSNSIKALDALRLPPGEPDLVVTVHYYLPFRFTHQGAAWAGLADLSGVTWSGTPSQRRAIETDLDEAVAWAAQNDRPLYLGEFGAYEGGDLASRTAWTSFVARQAQCRGWGWAYWQFDSDFVVYDVDRGRWVEAIRRALIPTAPSRDPAPSGSC